MTDETETQHELAAVAEGGADQMLMDPGTFEHAQRVAKLFASSQLVPKHLQNKPADCFLALHMAHRMREDPLMVAQNIVIIQGTAGWKAQWLIARANQMGAFSTRIKYRTEGSWEPIAITRRQKDNNGNWQTVNAEVPDIAVTAFARDEDGDEITQRVSMKDAIAEGWVQNPKYSSLPELMLSYRAATFLVSLHCPEAKMGYQTAEELEDMQAAGKLRDVTPRQEQGSATEALSALQTAEESTPNTQDPTETDAGADASEGGSETDAAAQEAPSRENAESGGNSVPLYGLDGDVHGTYQRQGSWLNALVKLLLQYEGQPEAVKPVVEANKAVIDRIRAGRGQEAKIDDLDALIDRLTAIDGESQEASGDESTDDWVSGYDAQSGNEAASDDALLGDINDGLEELVQAGEIEKIRERIQWAHQISDEGVRGDVLDELDNALTRAQGGGE